MRIWKPQRVEFLEQTRAVMILFDCWRARVVNITAWFTFRHPHDERSARSGGSDSAADANGSSQPE